MRHGRLAVISDGSNFRATEVIVMPDDGSEPIALKTHHIIVEAGVGELASARITAACTRLDITAIEGDESIRAYGKAEKPAYPLIGNGITVEDGESHESISARRLVWVFSGAMSYARMYLVGRRES